MRKIAAVLFILFIFTGLVFPLEQEKGQIELKLKIMASLANIREGPSIKSNIVKQARAGTILKAVGKKGNWYLVLITLEGVESEIKAYIHQSIVEEVIEPESVTIKSESINAPSRIEAKKPPQKKEIPTESKHTPYVKPTSHKKAYIQVSYSMGFLEEITSSSWSGDIYHETANTGVDYNIQKGNSISAAFGYRFYKFLAIELGADITSRNVGGDYSATIPHPLLFKSNRQAEGVGSYTLSENSIVLNLVSSIRSSTFGLEIFAGPAYILSKANIVSKINFSDSYPYDSISLNLNTADISKNIFGFNAGAHILFYFGENLAIYLDAHYISGKAVFETGTEVSSPQMTLGGFKSGAGLRILF